MTSAKNDSTVRIRSGFRSRRLPVVRLHARGLLHMLLLLAAAVSSCARPSERPNVLLVIVDTLRQDRVGFYGAGRETTPRLDALAAESCVFDRAYSVSSWTMPSIATIMTGLYPSSHRMTEVDRVLDSGARTLAEEFELAGYRTGAVVSHVFVDADHGFGQGFSTLDAENARGHDWISSTSVTDKAIRMLRDFAEDGDSPFFLFVHYFDPHFKYQDHAHVDFASSGAGRLDGTESLGQIRKIREELTDDELGFLLDLYDEEIRHTDHEIGRLLDALDEAGAGSNTVVVFTSDHGEEFLDHGKLGHRKTLYEEVVRVPLSIRYPGCRPGRIGTAVSTGSLAPTMLELAGVESDRLAAQFGSLIPLMKGEEEETTIYFETERSVGMADRDVAEASLHGIVHRNWKFLKDRLSGETEVYDLAADPKETTNLDASEEVPLGWLESKLSAAAEESSSRFAGAAPARELNRDEIRNLEALGYIGD